MEKKLFLISIAILLLTGCSSNYNLEIKNGRLYEKITAYVDSTKDNLNYLPGMEEDNEAIYFIESDQYPIYNNMEIKYDKKVNKTDKYTEVIFEHSFTEKEFENSNSLKKCFDNASYTYGDNIKLKLSGKFYCLHGPQLLINIKSNYKVIKNNADRKNGNTYTWIINSNNADNVSIDLEIDKYYYLKKYSMILSIVVISLLVLYLYKRIKKKRYLANKI